MANKVFDSIPATIDALDMLLIEHWNDLDPELRQKLFDLRAVGTSPVDRIVNSAELIYARADGLSELVKEVAAGAFRMAELMGWHGLRKGLRGSNAANVLEGADVPQGDVPEPKAQFLPPVAPQE